MMSDNCSKHKWESQIWGGTIVKACSECGKMNKEAGVRRLDIELMEEVDE